nr:FdhF/YdeP family oxidoreductase [uncultured Pseudomonas sp.]
MSKIGKPKVERYDAPSGGWGSARSVTEIVLRERVPLKSGALLARQNKHGGFACVSCAWAKPGKPHPLEFCENGAKATAWEVTSKRCGPEFFAQHSLSELRGWRDYDLEEVGRLTHPLRYDAATDRYRPVSWAEAFADIGAELKALAPDSVIFYASGRAALETSYLYQLYARLYGTNNLPDSSNMCHESTSVALPKSIGVTVGTVTLNDFDQADCLLFFGQNPGSNSPRMLHDLQEARKRGAPIITFNPLRERGLETFVNPQSPVEMLTDQPTQISTQYHQLKPGGDTAALAGLCKALLAADDLAREQGQPAVLDHAFIAEHCHGFADFCEWLQRQEWPQLERQSGLTRSALEAAAAVYGRCQKVIGIYGMGLTQHRHGVETIQMLTNLLLMRGNIGKPGAGICPVRGHSNVQGQRTVGITEKPELAPLEQLGKRFGFVPPQDKGRNTVEACEGILDGSVKAFISLGGNFLRAIPETSLMEPAWRTLRLSVQIATKLNRNHLVPADKTYLLPCLGRTEIDRQNGVEQAHSTEDSTGCIHGWRGVAEPPEGDLLSEPAIVAGLAKATLPDNPQVTWDAWVADYALIRDEIARSFPEIFHDFNARMWEVGGFHRPLPAAKREWKTDTGKANLIVPRSLEEDPDMPARGRDVLTLMTLRSNDQFNTTIYGYHDRFRGVKGTRAVLLMNRNDIERLGLAEGDKVQVSTVADDGVRREVGPLRVTPYNIPEGACGGYYPECNALIPLWHHAEGSKVPAAKAIPVRLNKLIAANNGSFPVEPEGYGALY